MKLCLFDSSPEATRLWRECCQKHELELVSFASWANHADLPEAVQITVFDESAVETPFVPTLKRICAACRNPVLAVTADTLAIREVSDLMSHGVMYVIEKQHLKETIERELPRFKAAARVLEDNKVEYDNLKQLFASLTNREVQVLDAVLAGVSNRDTAEQLNVSVRTVESRRAKVYRKLGSEHVADLVRKSDRLFQLRAIFEVHAEPDGDNSHLSHSAHMLPALSFLRRTAQRNYDRDGLIDRAKAKRALGDGT